MIIREKCSMCDGDGSYSIGEIGIDFRTVECGSCKGEGYIEKRIETVGNGPISIGDWVQAFKNYSEMLCIFKMAKADSEGVYYVNNNTEIFFEWSTVVKLSDEMIILLGLEEM